MAIAPPSVSSAPASASSSATPAPYALHHWTWRGYQIQYAVAGTGTPLVLIHGFGASIGHWKKNIPVWAAAGYQVFTLDLLGFGASEKPLTDYSLELWEDLLAEFSAELIGQPAVFIGNSIGALLSLMMAVNHPDQVSGIILLNCAGGLSHRPEELPPPLRVVMGTFNTLVNSNQLGPLMFNLVRRKPQIRRALQQVYRKPGSVTDELVDMLYEPSCDPNAQSVFASILTAPPGPTIETLLPKLEKPMLVLWGEDDPWTPVKGSQIFQDRAQDHAQNRNTTFISLPRTGHCPHDERPELVNPLILYWLKTITSTRQVSESHWG